MWDRNAVLLKKEPHWVGFVIKTANSCRRKECRQYAVRLLEYQVNDHWFVLQTRVFSSWRWQGFFFPIYRRKDSLHSATSECHHQNDSSTSQTSTKADLISGDRRSSWLHYVTIRALRFSEPSLAQKQSWEPLERDWKLKIIAIDLSARISTVELNRGRGPWKIEQWGGSEYFPDVDIDIFRASFLLHRSALLLVARLYDWKNVRTHLQGEVQKDYQRHPSEPRQEISSRWRGTLLRFHQWECMFG